MLRLTQVLHIITRLAHGGSERRLLDTVSAIDADHHVILGAEYEVGQLERLELAAVVSRCPALVRELSPAADVRALLAIRRTLREVQPDVVHTHQSKAGLLGRLAARSAGVSVVYHSASMASFGPGYPRGQSAAFALAERLTAPCVTRYLVVGSDLADRLVANGIARRRMEVVRSGLDLDPFVPCSADQRVELRRRFDAAEADHVLCYVGSLDDRKRVMALPGILARVRSVTGGRVVLLVAGDGPLREGLSAALGRCDRSGEARLLGHVPDPHEVMRASDALVLPSVAEGVPQVLVQAAACGVPFAAYDSVDGVLELASLGAAHATAPFGDEAALADAVVELLRPDGRTTAIDRADLAQWAPAVVRERYRTIYAEDLASGRSRGR